MVSCMAPNTDVALAIGPTVSVPLYCLAGYYLNLE